MTYCPPNDGPPPIAEPAMPGFDPHSFFVAGFLYSAVGGVLYRGSSGGRAYSSTTGTTAAGFSCLHPAAARPNPRTTIAPRRMSFPARIGSGGGNSQEDVNNQVRLATR